VAAAPTGRELSRSAAAGEALVSVVIPCHNQAGFLSEAIRSVHAQTLPAGEIIVIDDGSTDGSRAVAAGNAEVTVISQPQRGLAAARNRGLAESRGSFVVFLDADDRLLPEALRANLEQLAGHPSCALAAGHCRIIDGGGGVVAEYPQRVASGDLYLELAKGNFIAMPGTVMYRRSAVEKLGGFDSSVDAAADYDLYLRVALHFGIVVHASLIGEYRWHGGNMSNDPALMLAATLRVMRRNRRHLHKIPGGMNAYEAGLTFWKEKYGGRIGHEALFAMEQRRWKGALSSLSVLARYDRQRLWSVLRGARESNVVPFIVGVATPPPSEVSPEGSTTLPQIVQLHPAGTQPGVAFNVQPNGESALCLRCRNVPSDAVVMFDGQPLETTVAAPDFVSALVPRDFFAAPGTYPVYLRSSR
jgi:glycosyltransferase involved in cell wall biosynthesis